MRTQTVTPRTRNKGRSQGPVPTGPVPTGPVPKGPVAAGPVSSRSRLGSRLFPVGLLILSWLFLVGCESMTETAPAEAQVPAGSIELAMQERASVQGWFSGFSEPQRLVIRDEGAWAEAWGRIHSHLSDPPPLVPVDFDSSVVVLTAMGSRNTGGHRTTIESVHEHDGVLYVSVLEEGPGRSCMVPQVLTAPVHAVEVPTRSGEARFQVRERTRGC